MAQPQLGDPPPPQGSAEETRSFTRPAGEASTPDDLPHVDKDLMGPRADPVEGKPF